MPTSSLGQPGVAVPENVVTIGQTSLLGSMHVAFNPPPGQPPHGQLRSGHHPTEPHNDLPLHRTDTVVAVGRHQFRRPRPARRRHPQLQHRTAGNETQFRELLTRLNEFVGVLDHQRGKIIETIESFNRLAGTFAAQRDVINQALRKIPAALDVLIRERPHLTTALDKLHDFNTAQPASSTTPKPTWSATCTTSSPR